MYPMNHQGPTAKFLCLTLTKIFMLNFCPFFVREIRLFLSINLWKILKSHLRKKKKLSVNTIIFEYKYLTDTFPTKDY